MSSDPFSDDRAAAHTRADQLAHENERLRREIEQTGAGRRPSPPLGGAGHPVLRVLLALAAVSVVAGGGLAFVALGRHVSDSAQDGLRLDVQWRREATGTTGTVHGVWSDGRVAYAVGDGGMILFRDAAGQWSPQVSGVNATLRAVARVGHRTIAVGDGGTVVRFEDATRGWLREASGTPANLYAVAAGSENAEWAVAVGEGGTVLVRQRSEDGPELPRWVPEASGTTATLRALVNAPGAGLYAVGDDGTVLVQRRDPASGEVQWVAQQSHTHADLRAVAEFEGDLVAVGANGTVLRTSAQGSTPWSVSRAETRETLYALGAASVSHDFREGSESSMGSRTMLIAAGSGGVLFAYLPPSSIASGESAGWYPLSEPANVTLYGAAGAGGALLLVGEMGTALAGDSR